jgi:glutamate racemase
VNRAPIGIFDSGLGGLTVAHAIFEALPHDSTVYFGDTARVPYGPKSPDTVRRYSLEILNWLLEQRVKAVVVACNTSTAHALDALTATSPVPVIGVIGPGAAAAARATRSGIIGIIGTAGTVASRAYVRALEAIDPSLTVVQRACPLLVPLAEEGWFDHPAAELIASEYLAPLREAGVDTLVLGCTHYPLMAPLLRGLMGPEVTLVDSARETARAVAAALTESGLEAPGDSVAVHRFAASDDAARFREVGARFLGGKVLDVEVVQPDAVSGTGEA